MNLPRARVPFPKSAAPQVMTLDAVGAQKAQAAFIAWQNAIGAWLALSDQSISGTNPALAKQIADASVAATNAGTQYFIAVGPSGSDPTFVQLFKGVNNAVQRLAAIYATLAQNPPLDQFTATRDAGKVALTSATQALTTFAPNGVPPAPLPSPVTGILPPQLAATFQAMIANPAGSMQADMTAFASQLDAFGYTQKAAQLRAVIPQGQLPTTTTAPGTPPPGQNMPQNLPPGGTAPGGTAPGGAAPGGTAPPSTTPTAPASSNDGLLALGLVGIPIAVGYAIARWLR